MNFYCARRRLLPSIIRSVILLGGILVSPIYANDIEVSASIDKTIGYIEDYFYLSIEITGARGNIDVNTAPITDFNLLSQSHSSRINTVNFSRTSVTTTIQYTLEAKRTGQLKIPQLEVNVNNSIYHTRPLSIQAKNTPTHAGKKDERDLFLTATVSSATPYVGQQILLTMKFFAKVKFSDAQLEEPDYADFRMQVIKDNETRQDYHQGEKYQVIEIKRILIPRKAGALVLNRAQIETFIFEEQKRGQRRRSPFSDFFDMDSSFFTRKKRVRVRSNQIHLNVKPLPLLGQPKDFMNIVGRVRLTSNYDRNNIATGDSVTITIKVQADTDLEGITLNALPKTAAYNVYEDKPTYQTTVKKGTIFSEAVFKYAIVPSQAGMIVLPPFALSYFDTDKKQFRQAKSQPITLKVSQGETATPSIVAGNQQPTARRTRFKKIGSDILPIYEKVDALENQTLTSQKILLQASLPLLFLLLYLSLIYTNYKKNYAQENQSLLTKQKAFKKAQAQLATLEKSGAQNGLILPVSKILSLYIGEKLAVNTASLTSAEMEALLNQTALPAPTIQQIADLLHSAEASLYGAAVDTPQHNWLEHTRQLLRTMEKNTSWG